MAWGIGANDVANTMAISVGSKALRFGQALLVAGVFEFAGAFITILFFWLSRAIFS
jgi:PiT family inorganic phosphate transporter